MSLTESAHKGISNLIKLLPTGTVFLFQYLNPLITNNGQCDHPINKQLASIFVALCGFSCFFSSFTDSYVDDNGIRQCGIVTCTGLWAAGSTEKDLSSYRLRFGDFVHALCSWAVFAVVVLLDSNSVHCFYPSFVDTQKKLMMSLPPLVGFATGCVFALFPNRRHGVGYLSTTSF